MSKFGLLDVTCDASRCLLCDGDDGGVASFPWLKSCRGYTEWSGTAHSALSSTPAASRLVVFDLLVAHYSIHSKHPPNAPNYLTSRDSPRVPSQLHPLPSTFLSKKRCPRPPKGHPHSVASSTFPLATSLYHLHVAPRPRRAIRLIFATPRDGQAQQSGTYITSCAIFIPI